jgi:O-methyltransferase
MIKSIFLFLKKIGVIRLYRNMKNLLPEKVIKWVHGLSAKYDPSPLVIVEELKPQYENAIRLLVRLVGSTNLGDYLEFGVAHGTSLICMHESLQKAEIRNVRLFGFDSFEGLPDNAANDTTNDWKPGEFASTLEFTTEKLTKNGIDWTRTTLVKGWYSDTLTSGLVQKYCIAKASLINIDCDLYSSAKEALNFCAPLIKDSSVIFFDDWPEEFVGEKQAFEEFLKENQNFIVEEIGTYKPAGKIFLLQKKGLEKIY